MQFVIRVDDLGWISNGDPDPGLQLAQQFHAAMGGIPYLAAVIPAFLDEAGLRWLASTPEGMTVAIHGWNHKRSQNVSSEFHGLDQDSCRARIDRGRRLLRDEAKIEPDHLVLPYNAMEPPIPEACYHEKIGYIWGGGDHCAITPSPWPTPPQPYPLGRVGFVPSWALLYGATRWQMGADDRAIETVLHKLIDWPGKSVLTLHITWEASRGKKFEGVRWLVEQIRDRAITPEEYLR